jgi:hypothetical protein
MTLLKSLQVQDQQVMFGTTPNSPMNQGKDFKLLLVKYCLKTLYQHGTLNPSQTPGKLGDKVFKLSWKG